jgi:hypothetical protein
MELSGTSFFAIRLAVTSSLFNRASNRTGNQSISRRLASALQAAFPMGICFQFLNSAHLPKTAAFFL